MKRSLLLVASLTFASCAGFAAVSAWKAPPPYSLSALHAPMVDVLPAFLLATLIMVGVVLALSHRSTRRLNGERQSVRGHLSPLRRPLRLPRPPIVGLIAGSVLGMGMAAAQSVTSHGIDFGIFTPLIGPLLTAAAAAAAAALTYGASYLQKKTAAVKNEQFKHVLEIVQGLAFAKVGELAQAAIEKIKAASADGTLTTAEAAAALATAAKEVWKSLPATAQGALVAASGSEDQAIKDHIIPQVESAVRNSGSGRLLSSLGDAPARVNPLDLRAARARIGVQP